MAIEKIEEEIAERLYRSWGDNDEFTWEDLLSHRKDVYRGWVKDYILAKRVGDYTLEALASLALLAKKEGYKIVVVRRQSCLFDANWRKVVKST